MAPVTLTRTRWFRRLRPMSMPEKPSLDGLEAKWGEWWEAAGTYRFDRSKTRDQSFVVDTPPPTACGSLHVGHVMSYTQTDVVARYHRMHGRRSSTRWAGTTTAWPPSGACRTTSACAAIRRCPSEPDFDVDRARAPRRHPGRRRAGRTSSSCARTSRSRTRRRSRSSGAGSGCRSTGGRSTRRSARRRGGFAARHSAARATRAWRTRPRRRRCGTSTSGPRSRRPRSRTARSRARTTASPSRSRAARAVVEIATSRPELIPACVALVVNPADERYASLVGNTALTPVFRVPCRSSPTSWPTPRRARVLRRSARSAT